MQDITDDGESEDAYTPDNEANSTLYYDTMINEDGATTQPQSDGSQATLTITKARSIGLPNVLEMEAKW